MLSKPSVIDGGQLLAAIQAVPLSPWDALAIVDRTARTSGYRPTESTRGRSRRRSLQGNRALRPDDRGIRRADRVTRRGAGPGTTVAVGGASPTRWHALRCRPACVGRCVRGSTMMIGFDQSWHLAFLRAGGSETGTP